MSIPVSVFPAFAHPPAIRTGIIASYSHGLPADRSSPECIDYLGDSATSPPYSPSLVAGDDGLDNSLASEKMIHDPNHEHPIQRQEDERLGKERQMNAEEDFPDGGSRAWLVLVGVCFHYLQ